MEDMIGIIIVSHGNFASALLETCEMFIGKHDNVITVCYMQEESVESLFYNISKALDESILQDELIIFCDIKGGSPCNVALKLAINNNNIRVITGVNIPIVIEAINLSERESLDTIINYLSKIVPNSVEIF